MWVPLGGYRFYHISFQYFAFRSRSGELIDILHYLFVHIFLVSQGQETNFSLISVKLDQQILACIKFRPTFYPFFFLYTFLCNLILKVVKYMFAVFTRPFLLMLSLSWVAVLIIVWVPEIRSANVRRMPISTPWLSREHLPIMTLRHVE